MTKNFLFDFNNKMESTTTKIEKAVMTGAMFMVITLTLLAVFNRYVIKSTLMSWYQEVNLLFYMILVFWGSSNVAKGNYHMKLELLALKLKDISLKKRNNWYHKYNLINNIFCFIISLMGTYYILEFVILTRKVTPILRIPTKITLSISLVGGFLGLTLSYLVNILNILEEKSLFNKTQEKKTNKIKEQSERRKI